MCNRKWGLLLLTVCLYPAILFSQNNINEKFYYSHSAPKELNTSSSERLDSLFGYYYNQKDESVLKNYSKTEYEDFIYRVNYFIENLNKSGKIFYDNEISDYLNSLKDFLLSDNENKDRVKVLLTNYPSFNAFTNDFGYIYVNVATLAYVECEEEFLALLAHELSHYLYKHTHSFENFTKELEEQGIAESDYSSLKMHTYSKEQEYEADLAAFKMLQSKGVNLEKAVILYEKLKFHADPCFISANHIPFFGSQNDSLNNYLSNIHENREYHHNSIVVDKNDSASTHPEIDKRLDKLIEFIMELEDYQVTYMPDDKKFSQLQKTAVQLLLNSYIESGWYIKGLDLVLKLRSKDPDNETYIIAQAKVMTLLTQSKYDPYPFKQFLNDEGGEYLDTNFMKFKEEILAFDALEFNIISLIIIDELIKDHNIEYLNRANKYLYQFLYKYNENLYVNNGNGLSYIKTNKVSDEFITTNDMNPLYFMNTYEKEVYDEAIDDDHMVHISTNDFNDFDKLIKYYISHFPVDKTKIDIITEYKERRDRFERTLTIDQYAVDFDFSDVKSVSKRPKIVFSNDFNPDVKTVLVQTSNYHFKKTWGDNKILFKKSLELEDFIGAVLDTMLDFRANYSNVNFTQLSISDAYKHYCFMKWVDERFKLNDLIYSSVDEQIEHIRTTEDIRYLLVNINIISEKNSLFGKKFKTQTFNIYFDLENEGVVYISTLGSTHRANDIALKQLIYLTDHLKTKVTAKDGRNE